MLLDDDEAEFIAQQNEALWAAFKWKPPSMLSPAPARLIFLGGDPVHETQLRVADARSGTLQGEPDRAARSASARRHYSPAEWRLRRAVSTPFANTISKTGLPRRSQ